MPLFIGIQWPSAEEARACDRGDINLSFCSRCGFIWNRKFAAERLSYAPGYDNSLDWSSVFQSYTRELVRRLVNDHGIRGKQVVELGCGNGRFLALLCEEGGNRGVGFDPSYQGEQSNAATDRVTFIRDFFGEKYASYAGDLVCCRHVFEHVVDPVGFLQMVRRILGARPSAIIYFEVPNVRFILDQLSIWDIIYEHCNYFSSESLGYLFQKCGFEVLRMDEPYDGQFLSIEARGSESDQNREAQPADLGNLTGSVQTFAEKVVARFEKWNGRLAQFERDGTRAVVWGGGAKTVSFLNMLKNGSALPYVVDINPGKQGRYLAGTGQRIVSPEFLREFQPTHVILMNPIYHQEVQDHLRILGVFAEILDV